MAAPPIWNVHAPRLVGWQDLRSFVLPEPSQRIFNAVVYRQGVTTFIDGGSKRQSVGVRLRIGGFRGLLVAVEWTEANDGALRTMSLEDGRWGVIEGSAGTVGTNVDSVMTSLGLLPNEKLFLRLAQTTAAIWLDAGIPELLTDPRLLCIGLEFERDPAVEAAALRLLSNLGFHRHPDEAGVHTALCAAYFLR